MEIHSYNISNMPARAVPAAPASTSSGNNRSSRLRQLTIVSQSTDAFGNKQYSEKLADPLPPRPTIASDYTKTDALETL